MNQRFKGEGDESVDEEEDEKCTRNAKIINSF